MVIADEGFVNLQAFYIEFASFYKTYRAGKR